MREAAADLDFEEAARLRDEIKRLRATEMAVVDDPTAKTPSPRLRGEGKGGLRPPSSSERTPTQSVGYGEGRLEALRLAGKPPHPDRCAIRPLPARRGEVKAARAPSSAAPACTAASRNADADQPKTPSSAAASAKTASAATKMIQVMPAPPAVSAEFDGFAGS